MDIADVVVGRFVVANHPVGYNLLNEVLFDEPVLEVGKHYKVLAVDEVFEGDRQPILIELDANATGNNPSGWWCHPKYFTALEGSL